MPTPSLDWQTFANDPALLAAAQQQAQLDAAMPRQVAIAQQNGNMDPNVLSGAQKQQGLDWVSQMLAAGGADPNSGMFSAQNIEKTPGVAQYRTQQAQEAQTNATNARYGTDLSWLDPSFQYSPTTIGASAGAQAYADPTAIAAQNSAMQQAQQFANSNLQFQSPAQQQALMQQWAGIQSGQGAPTFMGNGQQQALMQGLLGVKAPQFAGAGDQRAVLAQAMGMASNTGPGSLQFDTSGRQGEQYGNLQDIIKGGGATAIEMADRQRARADSESWLRGQREADMADYAERGLTGSGMELLNLSSDRQAAAGRNSQADLEMAKALEERRLGAINSAAGLATNMRGQTVDEQGLLNNRATSGLNAATGLVNNMRSSDIQEQMGLNSAAQAQFTNAAGIAGTMRGQDMSEKSYLDQRAINALSQQTDLSNTMRGQTAAEQIANQSAKQAGLNTLASTSTSARGQSADEAQYRATSADTATQLNQSAINKAKSENTNFLQNAQTNMMNNRQTWEQLMAQLGNKTASTLLSADQQENVNQANSGAAVGGAVANQYNNNSSDLRNATLGAAGTATANQLNNAQTANQLYPDAMGWIGGVVGTVGSAGINAGTGIGSSGGGAAGGIPSAGSTSLSMPTGGSNPYGVGVGGGSNTGTYGANLGGGQLQMSNSFLPQGYKLEDLNK